MEHAEFFERISPWPRVDIKLFLDEFEFTYQGEPYTVDVQYISPLKDYSMKAFTVGGLGTYVFRLFKRVIGEESEDGVVKHVDGAARSPACGDTFDLVLVDKAYDIRIPLRITCFDLRELTPFEWPS
ncbi:MAG: hypothetical protein ACFFER_15760 [Candidatus Thorarchaeota archaeon]